jgi:fucose permease
MYAFIALGLPDGMLGTAWPSVRHSFHVPLEDLGVVLLAGTVGAVALSAVSGLVIQRIGIARTVRLGGALAGTGAIGLVLSPAFWTFVLAGAAIGLSAALIDGSINSAIALAGRNRLLNLVHGSYGIGTTVGPLVVTGAVLVVSWRPAYGFLFLADIVLIAGWWLAGRSTAGSPAPGGLVPAAESLPVAPPVTPPPVTPPPVTPPPVTPPPVTPPAGPPPVASPPTAAPPLATPLTAPPLAGPGLATPTPAIRLSKARLVTVIALGLVVFMVYTGFEASAGQWAASFERGPLHLGAGATGLATFGYWGALTLARFALAVPRRRIAPLTIVRWGCAIAVAGAALVWWRPATVVALVGLVIIGGALAGVFPALVALTPERVGEEMARHVIGWQIGAAWIGGAGISAVFGVVFQEYGLKDFGPALMVVAVLLIVGSVGLERAAVPAGPR